MTVTNADKIAAIQSVIDGVPPWADMSAFRAILDDYQQPSSSRWQSLETAPRHGNYARVSVEEGVLFCPNGGEATHWMPLPTDKPSAALIPAPALDAKIAAVSDMRGQVADLQQEVVSSFFDPKKEK